MTTEIFATFGPACGEENILKEMIDAGMTGMRLNLSHTTLPASEAYIKAYQNAAKEAAVVPQILIDMQGPELRIGQMTGEMFLEEGQRVVLFNQEQKEEVEGNDIKIPVPLPALSASETGDEILMDDGKILVEVISTEENQLTAKVIRGGRIQGRKSIKIKEKNVKMPPLTLHDIENIKLANQYGVAALMQPFVLSGEDLSYVRSVLKQHHAENIKIYAKIENMQGVENLESILPEADAVIIARGDLGNDMPLWELPRVQKQIEEACKRNGVPYVVVTQMLASMEEHPVPTRAEVSDIFHAVYHGAWGVMVTGETAVGKYPVEAVKYLTNTAREAVKHLTNTV